jgi:hypothetical protein
VDWLSGSEFTQFNQVPLQDGREQIQMRGLAPLTGNSPQFMRLEVRRTE